MLYLNSGNLLAVVLIYRLIWAQISRANFEKRMGCSPRFNSPWHPSSTGLAERAVGNVKTIVSKLAINHANTNTCSPVSVLKYIDVCITNDDSNVTKYTNALCDSGAEICVIKSLTISASILRISQQLRNR